MAFRCSGSSNTRSTSDISITSTPCAKVGAVRMIALGTFENFNEVVAGLKGSIAMGAGVVSDSLMVSSLDEVSTDYGLIAEAVAHPADFSSATFRCGRTHVITTASGNGRGRDLLHEVVQEAQPCPRGLLSPRRENGADRGTRGHLHIRRSGKTLKCR